MRAIGLLDEPVAESAPTWNASGAPAFSLVGPGRAGQSPLVFDSPHSWRDWPAQGPALAASEQALRTGCDAWIDELWARAARGQAPVLAAGFHRAYIDANRARDDIDPALLAGPWPEPVHASSACQRGMGLIRRLALPGVPLYDQPLTVEDVRARIERCYDPYHQALTELIDAAHGAFGLSCHIDCHSMKSMGNAMNIDHGKPRPDIVVSDLNGQACDPFLLRWITTELLALGYRVQVNHPYAGAELVRRHGRPAQGRHSVQIEINRALYMDEARFEKHEGFERLGRDLEQFVSRLDQGLRLALYPSRPVSTSASPL